MREGGREEKEGKKGCEVWRGGREYMYVVSRRGGVCDRGENVVPSERQKSNKVCRGEGDKGEITNTKGSITEEGNRYGENS